MGDRICLFMQNRDFFGAVLQHIPLLHSLRTRFPKATINLFTPVAQAQCLVDGGLADRLVLFHQTTIGLAATLRKARPDVVISLRPTSTWITCSARLSGAPVRLGYDGPLSGLLLSHSRPRDRSIYRAENYQRLLAEFIDPEPLSAAFVRMADQAPESTPERPFYCLIPGGGTGAFKRWPIGSFLKLCEQLRAEWPASRFVFLLGDKERGYAPQIAASSVADVTDVRINAPIGLIARLSRSSDCVIANDCGPCHIAQMVGAPYVGLFSNHDGDVQNVVAEWFLPRANAAWVAGNPGEDIASLSVENAHAAVRSVTGASAAS